METWKRVMISQMSQRSDMLPQPDMGKDKSGLYRVFDVLEELYGNEGSLGLSVSEEPLDGLILTILSQNTNDINRDRAYRGLRQRLPTWGQVALAEEQEIEDAIRVAGLGKHKAGRIKEVLLRVKDRFGDYTLAPLKGRPREEVEGFLCALPGVGPKTVACVLVFDLGVPAFPVDTHVARLAVRLGFAPPGTEPPRIQSLLEAALPPHRYIGAHVNMISHGRAICRARDPKCGVCLVEPLCPKVRVR